MRHGTVKKYLKNVYSYVVLLFCDIFPTQQSGFINAACNKKWRVQFLGIKYTVTTPKRFFLLLIYHLILLAMINC